MVVVEQRQSQSSDPAVPARKQALSTHALRYVFFFFFSNAQLSPVDIAELPEPRNQRLPPGTSCRRGFMAQQPWAPYRRPK